ncbi:Phospholipid phosphatase 2 [Eumeta japonica]|uniref:Phospholipid phosphatase 2 n=1 Tax=Eumeta variegata TaxID=151549 RepID=A0A4C1VAQ0_EUMVA|nr:Phospholipid phosphatase 2 [Eumeta japonica]
MDIAGAIVLFELGVFPSHRAGFWCRDPALSFAHSGDTFSITAVGAATIFLPLIVIWTVEALSHRQDEYTLKQSRLYASGKPSLLIYKDYIYGAVVNLAILEALKCLVGSPRPSFFDLCQPDKAASCNESEYVTNYVCTSVRYSPYLQIDSSRSFPSAHSSLAIYCGLFVAWYLQRRAFSWHSRSVLLVPLIQGLCVLYAAATSLSRLSDHRHHWWDVLAGVIIGTIIAVYTVQVLCKNFSQPAVPSTSDISSSEGNNHQSVRRLLSREPHVVIP